LRALAAAAAGRAPSSLAYPDGRPRYSERRVVGEGGVKSELTIEAVGDVVVARLRGEPTIELLKECQERVLELARAAGKARVLYDALGMMAPSVDVPWSQRTLDAELADVRLRRAIVVPSTKLAYLARLAFGDGDYRVFYDDVGAAVRWLNEPIAD
jgi:hypothetical protein